MWRVYLYPVILIAVRLCTLVLLGNTVSTVLASLWTGVVFVGTLSRFSRRQI
jgi:hypothetical protein